MKLLFCDSCHDIICLRVEKWRKCSCGKLGGQYNYDQVTATIGGKGRIFGVANNFLGTEWLIRSEEEKAEFRSKYYPEGKGSDCWWGEYQGDVQLFRIKNSDGPRLKVKVRNIDSVSVKIIICDRRKYLIGDIVRKKEVILPYYQGIQLTKKAA